MSSNLLGLDVPDKWSIKKLQRICDIKMGQSPPGSTYNEEGFGLPFFQGNADFGLENPHITTWCSEPKKIADINDLLISVRAPVGELNIANVKSCIGRGLSALTVKEKNNQRYVYYVLQYFNRIFRRIEQGSTFKAINKTELVNFPVLIPNELKEQTAIVSILENVDHLIQTTQALITHLQTLKRGLMQRLFTEGIDHNEFKLVKLKSQQLKIPKKWSVQRLQKICVKITSGGTPSRKKLEYYINGSIPWIKSGEVLNALVANTEEKITQEALENSSSKIFPPYTVLFALYGATAGRVGYIDSPMCTNQAILGIMTDEQVLHWKFLFYYFQFRYERIIAQRIGGAQPNLNGIDIKRLKILVPNTEEQKNIANILSNVDDKIENEKNYTLKLKNIKKGLMQVLLTGKKRVKLD